jgi:cytochrome c oxidase subunit 3
MTRLHPYHLVDVSPWPIILSFGLLTFATNLALWISGTPLFDIFISIAIILLIAYQWWRDVIRESKGGYHTVKVQKGILIGFLLFLISEVMLFLSFFWTFFHSSLVVSVELGAFWPPVGINAVNVWALPLLGSTVLLASGFVLTLAHHALILGNKRITVINMFLTIILGLLFTYIQYNEYNFGEFTIADSVFGSIFYMTTGLHAIHVIVGALFLIICFIRILLDQFTTEHHLGYEFAIYYWHLVDVVWLLVFLIYYWWGS